VSPSISVYLNFQKCRNGCVINEVTERLPRPNHGVDAKVKSPLPVTFLHHPLLPYRILSRTPLLTSAPPLFTTPIAQMELPSTRELELEVLLREKDAQLTEVTVCLLPSLSVLKGIYSPSLSVPALYRMKFECYDNTWRSSLDHPQQSPLHSPQL
jgi:hypothetical protein